MSLEGRHLLVTGASAGIGAELARELHARGARLTLLGRDPQRLAAVAAATGGHPLVVDLADPAAVATVVADAEAANGPLDVLVNNAGVAVVGPADAASAHDVEHTIRINVTAPIELCRQALPGMRARGSGHLVNVSSLAGVSAVPDLAVYGASKAALHHWTSIARRELVGSGVLATLVTLGEVAGTAMMEQARTSPTIDAVSRRLARLLPVMSPASVAAALAQAIEARRAVVTIPRRLHASVVLRDVPSALQDLAFVGLGREARGGRDARP